MGISPSPTLLYTTLCFFPLPSDNRVKLHSPYSAFYYLGSFPPPCISVLSTLLLGLLLNSFPPVCLSPHGGQKSLLPPWHWVVHWLSTRIFPPCLALPWDACLPSLRGPCPGRLSPSLLYLLSFKPAHSVTPSSHLPVSFTACGHSHPSCPSQSPCWQRHVEWHRFSCPVLGGHFFILSLFPMLQLGPIKNPPSTVPENRGISSRCISLIFKWQDGCCRRTRELDPVWNPDGALWLVEMVRQDKVGFCKHRVRQWAEPNQLHRSHWYSHEYKP